MTPAQSRTSTETDERRSSVDTIDRHGRVTKSTLGRRADFSNVAPLEYVYDAKGRIEKQKQGEQAWTFAYDAKNRLQSRTNAAGDAVTYTYDDADRVLTKSLPGNKVYRYAYDHDGVITKLTTPRGKVHTFDATTGGRQKSYTPPAAAHEGAVADPAQYLNTFTTENDLASVKLPSGALQDFDDDAAGRSTGEDHVQTKRTYDYDGVRDRYSKVTRKLANGSGEQSIDYGYDGLLPKSLDFTGAATGKAEFTFGGRMLPSEEKLTVGTQVSTRALEHDGDGLRIKDGPFTITRGGPLGAVSKISDGTGSVEFDYDSSGRPTTRKLVVAGAEKLWQKLTIDKSLRGSQREERVAGGALDTLTFEYDAASQLKKVKRGADVLEDYGYDDGGNRTSANGKAAAYDDQDRVTTRDGIVHKWDADGFLVKRGTDTFSWSRSGELLTATIGGATVTYAYDAFGRRTARTDANGTTKYLYTNPGNVWQVTASVDAAGTLSTYFYDSDDRLYGIQRGSERFYVGTDPVGSPRIVVKGDGTVVRRVDYTAFGEERNATGSFDLPLGYAGGLRDGATGLVRFGLRDYDAAAGRFVARDPSFFRGSPENLYAYVNNNPVTQKDPTGLTCGGWSGYAVFGGGFQLCRDNKWDAVEAQWSFCGEVGVGEGGGAELDFAQGAQDPVTSIVAEVSGKAGIFGATVGGELNLDCMQGKITGKVNAGPVMIGASTADEITIGATEWDNLGKWGAKVEAKVAVKKCWRW
jgi:RHS repeat-associated protein